MDHVSRHTPGHRPTRVCAVALAAVLAGGVSACGQGTPVGTALANPNKIQVGAKALPIGAKIGFLAVTLDNTSKSTVTITSIPIQGSGVGTVVKVVQEQIAPLTSGRNAVPASLYGTNPPVWWVHPQGADGQDVAGCHRQILVPVDGYKLRPGKLAWLWEVFQAVRPGKYVVPVHAVYYTQNGTSYREVVTQDDYGQVAEHAHYIPPDPNQVRCLRQTGAKLLNPDLPA
jgi:hypothetical protein